jgi:acyl-coenzyme A synthetase/AMP-(fatty) acid ligase
MHIVDMVYFWARTMPRHPAVIQPDGIVTYLALAQGIERAAEHFARTILDRSRPVAVSIENAPRMLVASLGLLRAGFNIVPVAKDLFQYLPAAGTSTLVCERGGATLDGGTNILFDESWLTVGTNLSRTDGPIQQTRTKDVHPFFFTSGTTGRPKLAARTQKDWEQRILFSGTASFTSFERALIVPGLATSMGFTRACEVLYAGKTVCFASFGQPMLWLANTYDVDMMVAAPQQALALAEIQEKVTRYPLAALKSLRIGGSIIARDGIERIRNHLCRNVILIYSSADAGTVAIAPYDMIADIPGAVGFTIPEVEIEIVDAAGHILPLGSEGFVRVRTPQFVEKLPPGTSDPWYYPGDIGWLTDNGVLCIAGRKGDVLNRGGVKLSVTDFENFLLTCPGVKDAGVSTLMGTSGFEEVWVGVVLDPSIDMAAFRQAIEANAEFGKNIDKLFVVEAIPRGTLGKIQREELKKMLMAIGEDAVQANAES